MKGPTPPRGERGQPDARRAPRHETCAGVKHDPRLLFCTGLPIRKAEAEENAAGEFVQLHSSA